MTRHAPLGIRAGTWLVGAVLGVLAGAVVLVPPWTVVLAAAGIVAAVVLVRIEARTELVVAAYWLTFGVFSTMLVDAVISGMFYPFYVALAVGAGVGLIVGGLRLAPVVAWTYVGFLALLVAALVGFADSVPIDRLIVYPFGALVLLQFRSRAGLHLVAGAAIATSLAVSAWVIVSAVQGDFAYRGNIDVNENVVSFYIGLGFVVAFAERLQGARQGRATLATAGLLIALAVMAYALMLLASRGMILALALTLAALFLRAALLDPRRLRLFAVLVAVAAAGVLLPGGQGILQRFENPNTATGGGRTQIWGVVGESLAASSAGELAFGHGFEASSALVAQNFGSLDSTHNAYLQVLYDLGIVGAVLFLVLHGYAIVASWSVPARDGALMLGLVVFLLGGNLFMSTTDDFLYWTALGFALAIGTWHARGRAPAPATAGAAGGRS